MFGRFEKSTSRVAFNPQGIVNFASINEPLVDAIGYPGRTESRYPSIGEKPGKGTDVGHVIIFNDQPFIVKTGITLSLLGQAVENVVQGRKEKAEQKLGMFIVGNYTRIANIEDKAVIAELKSKILKAFGAYLESEHGKTLQDLIKHGHKINSDDVYAIYSFLTQAEPALKNVIGLPAFADVVSGCHSQHFNNVFQAQNGCDVAPHKLLMQPKDKPGIFQGSRLLEDITPFDQFLLEPFAAKKEENQSDEEWVNICTEKLKAKLAAQSLNGLCSGILLRHILGESADNGPDNMLLSDKGLINIDLTGCRYPRKDLTRGGIGWGDTLATNDSNVLLDRIFDKTVFKNRFVQDSSIPANLKDAVFQAIVNELKASVKDNVVDEVTAVRNWLADMNASLVNDNLARATREVYGNLNEQFKFSDTHLDTLIAFNQQFIAQAAEVAKLCKQNLEMQMEVVRP
ncbi:TPA: hypothetical protein ACT9LE_002732 [Legionella pneumophila]